MFIKQSSGLWAPGDLIGPTDPLALITWDTPSDTWDNAADTWDRS